MIKPETPANKTLLFLWNYTNILIRDSFRINIIRNFSNENFLHKSTTTLYFSLFLPRESSKVYMKLFLILETKTVILLGDNWSLAPSPSHSCSSYKFCFPLSNIVTVYLPFGRNSKEIILDYLLFDIKLLFGWNTTK